MFWKRWGNWKKRRYILGVLLISLMITGCAERTNRYQNLDSEKITIIATLFPQYDFAREIAKDYANVILLLPPGMESHSFDPSPADIIAIGNSDVFLYTGAYMEAWAEDIISGIHTKKVHVKDVSEHITLVKEEEIEQEHEAEHGHVYQEHEHEYDPHIWTNPVYAMTMVENIKEALIEADPEHKEGYEKNADIYLKNYWYLLFSHLIHYMSHCLCTRFCFRRTRIISCFIRQSIFSGKIIHCKASAKKNLCSLSILNDFSKCTI